MNFSEIKNKIINHTGFTTLEEIKQSGCRIVKERDGDRYFLARAEELKPLLVKLGDIAEVRFGIKTGANEFFYLQPQPNHSRSHALRRNANSASQTLQRQNDSVAMRGKDVGAAFTAAQSPNHTSTIYVKNAAGWEGFIEEEFLKPVIKSPRECKSILVNPKDLKYKIFMCHKTKKELQGARALEYIEWGEKQGYHTRPSCKGRPRWWDLKKRLPAKINCNYLVDDRMRFYYDYKGIYVSDNFQEIHSSEKFLSAFLSTPFTQILCELSGRTPFGGGLLKVQTYEVAKLLVLNPLVFSRSYALRGNANSAPQTLQRQRAGARPAPTNVGNDAFLTREIQSIFTELGIDPTKPIRSQKPKPLPDRKALDDVVFDILGLTQEEREEVYLAVCELVKNRLDKAKSV